MKFGLIPETDNTNSTRLKKLYDDIISRNYDVIVIFPIFWPIWSNPEARD